MRSPSHRLPAACAQIVGEHDDEGFLEPAAELQAALARAYGSDERSRLVSVAGTAHAIADEPGLEPAGRYRTLAASSFLASTGSSATSSRDATAERTTLNKLISARLGHSCSAARLAAGELVEASQQRVDGRHGPPSAPKGVGSASSASAAARLVEGLVHQPRDAPGELERSIEANDTIGWNTHRVIYTQ